MNRKDVKVVAVLPIGPDNDGVNTIESILFYMGPEVQVITINDSKDPSLAKRLEDIDSRISVLKPYGHGIGGGLWTNLARAYKHAVENFNFDVLLRIDTDALVIAPNAENEAIEMFKNNPDIGMLGSYKFDCNGDKRDFKVCADVIRREFGIRGFTNPKRRKLLRTWIAEAEKNGYQLGEHTLGGACFQSYACIKAMADRGFLDTDLFLDGRICEDFMFGLLTYACGHRLEDFATKDLPLGLRWRGLPDSPENLIKRNKKIIHSTKFWKDMDWQSIDAFFKERRI